MLRLSTSSVIFTNASLLVLAAIVHAQEPRKNPNAPKAPLQIQQLVAPSFRVTPMVLTFESRRGRTVPFEFTLESVGKGTRVQVLAVALRQEESGVIMPDDKPLGNGVVKFEQGSEMVLQPGEVRNIKGEIRIPATDSNFLTYGILVKDFGQEQDDNSTPANGEARVRLKFVTQYLCRCDVQVQGARAGDISKLELQRTEVIEANGMPQARAFINNPTDSPFEFEIRCKLGAAGNDGKRKPFNLIMPARSSLEEPQRFVARILPHSRIRMEAPVPDPVFAGNYQLDADLLASGRTVSTIHADLDTRGKEFPAQLARVVEVGQGVSVTPAQIELSLQKGGERTQTVSITNTNAEPVSMRLVPLQQNGQLADWLMIRPAEVVVPGGSTRKVSVSQAMGKDQSENRYGRIGIESQLNGKPLPVASLMTAMVAKQGTEPQVELIDMRWDANPRSPAFFVKVSNTGKSHAPLDGRITLANETGQALQLQAGYGKWLMPGETTELKFPLSGFPEDGNYSLRTEIKFSDLRPQLARTDAIQMQGASANTSESAKSTRTSDSNANPKKTSDNSDSPPR